VVVVVVVVVVVTVVVVVVVVVVVAVSRSLHRSDPPRVRVENKFPYAVSGEKAAMTFLVGKKNKILMKNQYCGEKSDFGGASESLIRDPNFCQNKDICSFAENLDVKNAILQES